MSSTFRRQKKDASEEFVSILMAWNEYRSLHNLPPVEVEDIVFSGETEQKLTKFLADFKKMKAEEARCKEETEANRKANEANRKANEEKRRKKNLMRVAAGIPVDDPRAAMFSL